MNTSSFLDILYSNCLLGSSEHVSFIKIQFVIQVTTIILSLQSVLHSQYLITTLFVHVLSNQSHLIGLTQIFQGSQLSLIQLHHKAPNLEKKTFNCVVFINFQHSKFFFSKSHARVYCTLQIFLKFREFQPRYSF